MFVELHIIQNFPPSNLNRDDIGQPKDCDLGGFRRARISSQCQKRAIRWNPEFVNTTQAPLGSRTKLIVQELTKRLTAQNIPEEQARQAAILFAEAYSGKMDQKRKEQTAVLLYLSESEFEWVAGQLQENWGVISNLVATPKPDESDKSAKGKKGKAEKADASVVTDIVNELIKETKGRTSAPDIALFGRMLADKPETNIDAACQVAHAISTHTIGKMDLDYYTAVDDLQSKDKAGAGFLDVAYFTSACFYRYARLDWEQLKKNLQDDDLAVKTVEGFLRAAEAAIPSGKENSFAQQCRPSFMLAMLRDKDSAGWSLVNAFEKPVSAKSEGDLIEASVKRLDTQLGNLCDFYGDDSIKAIAVALPDGLVTPDQLSDILRGSVKNMQGWIDAICAPLRQGG